MIEKIHPTTISTNVPGEQLGREIAALRYDLIPPIIEGMLAELERQALGDGDRGRVKLKIELIEAQYHLDLAREAIVRAVKICQPYINEEIARDISHVQPVVQRDVGSDGSTLGLHVALHRS